ncbi:MAG: preprotein translocase subunit SecE [Deltaproteobacteria bacterium]|jgi:preprotein translocase subunit SecE|nr:preprotein translocase subunit SecE [Deltaproteobacteria bacterium]
MEKGPGVDPKRIVAIFYFFAAVVVGIFLEKILGIVFSYARLNDIALLGDEWTLTTVLGYGIAAVLAVLAWRSPRVNGVSMQVAQELELVSWPNLRETRASTVAVVVFTFVAAFTLGIFDLVWSRLSALVY